MDSRIWKTMVIVGTSSVHFINDSWNACVVMLDIVDSSQHDYIRNLFWQCKEGNVLAGVLKSETFLFDCILL